MISLFNFSKENSTIPQNVFEIVCNKTGFFNSMYSFCHNVRRCIGNKLKKALSITCEASSEIYVPQYFKKKKMSFIALKVNIKYFLLH